MEAFFWRDENWFVEGKSWTRRSSSSCTSQHHVAEFRWKCNFHMNFPLQSSEIEMERDENWAHSASFKLHHTTISIIISIWSRVGNCTSIVFLIAYKLSRCRWRRLARLLVGLWKLLLREKANNSPSCFGLRLETAVFWWSFESPSVVDEIIFPHQTRKREERGDARLIIKSFMKWRKLSRQCAANDIHLFSPQKML